MKTILSIIALATISFSASAIETFKISDKEAFVEYVQKANDKVYVNVFGDHADIDAYVLTKELAKSGVKQANYSVTGIKSGSQYVVVFKDSEMD